MEKELEILLNPGTAGLAQRIPLEAYKAVDKPSKMDLYIVEYNKVMPCGQNQY